MGSVHAAGEWLRLSEHYRGLTDGELIAIAGDRSKLTEIAQQVLAQELSQRKLKVEPEEERGKSGVENPHSSQKRLQWGTRDSGDSASGRDGDADDSDAIDPYEEDRKLYEICTVWSLRDAQQVQSLLDGAGIPFFMGEEKATSVNSVTSNYAQGVSVKIMRIGWPWATQALQYYEPKDVPASEKQEWDEEADVRCPSCRSKDIVFEKLVKTADGAPPKFTWTCNVCGNEWQDDGVATKG